MNLNYARYVDKWGGLVLCLLLFALDRALRPLTGRVVHPLLATTPPRDGAPVERPRRILTIKFYGLGNAVMLLPVLEVLRGRYPDAEIDVATLAGNVTLFERSGAVARVFGVDVRSIPRFVRSFAGALRAMRGRRYDTVLDFEQFVKVSALIAFLTGARRRIGFNTDGQRRGFMYTTRVVYTDSDHMSAIFARLLRPLGIEGELPRGGIRIDEHERRRVQDFLAAGGIARDRFPLVAFHVGIGMNYYEVPLKRWQADNFAAVAGELMQRHGAAVVLTGQGAQESALIAGVQAQLPRPALDACDRFTVTELAALLERCHFVVANDTSVMHLAALVGTPVVALFGPTAPLHYGPRGERHLVIYRDLFCSPCLTNYNLKTSRCHDPVCMRGIHPDTVLAAIEREYLGPTAAHRDWLRARPPQDASAA